jgi:putative hemolysin
MLKLSTLLAVSALLILISSGVGCATSEAGQTLKVCSASASVTITGVVVAAVPPVLLVVNPAAVYCADQGYRYEIRTDPVTGVQTGYCIFPDGTECDEWDFFRGSCGYNYVPSSQDYEVGEVVEVGDVELEDLLVKEAQGTLTGAEAEALANKRENIATAEMEVLEAKMEVLGAGMAVLGAEMDVLTQKKALLDQEKEGERRSLAGEPDEGGEQRISDTKKDLMILYLKLEALEIEERAVLGTTSPEDSSRLVDLSAAIAYLEG